MEVCFKEWTALRKPKRVLSAPMRMNWRSRLAANFVHSFSGHHVQVVGPAPAAVVATLFRPYTCSRTRYDLSFPHPPLSLLAGPCMLSPSGLPKLPPSIPLPPP